MVAIAAYRTALEGEEQALRRMLASGVGSAAELAVQRGLCEILRYEIRFPGSLVFYEQLGLGGSEQWVLAAKRKSSERLTPHYGSDAAYERKFNEYLDLSHQMQQWKGVRQEVIQDKRAGRQYLVFGANQLVPKITKIISTELILWFKAQPRTRDLLAWDARQGLAAMLTARPDLATLLRLADRLPLDYETTSIPIDRSAMAQAVEFAIGLIPVVGSVVAAYEAWSGQDLFSDRLSDLDRGILAAAVLLPIAGRFYPQTESLNPGSRNPWRSMSKA